MIPKVNLSKCFYYILAFFLGSIFSQVMYHIRFNKDLLRREMLLLMAESNSGYFLDFIILDVWVIIFVVLWVLFEKRKLNLRFKNG